MGRGTGIRTTSSRSIQIDFKWQGRRYRERLRLAPTPPNLKYAARLKATIEHEIATGQFDFAKHFPRSPRRGLGGNLLSRILSDYVAGLERQLEPETVAEYRLDAEAFVRGVGDCPVGQLTRAHIRDFINRSALSKKRLDNILVPARGAFRQAVEDGILESNPLADFRIRRVQKADASKIDPFTPEEVAAIAATDLGALWSFWVWTGLRSGELIGLEWSDVEADRSSIGIRRAVRVGRTKSPKTKSGNRTVTLLPGARAALDRIAQGEGPVFRNPGTGRGWYEDRALARAFRKACAAAGVRYRYPYQLRHTFASWALSAGENPAWVAKQMGHRDTLMVLRVYGRWIPQVDPGAGSKMAVMASR
jgi:integrase